MKHIFLRPLDLSLQAHAGGRACPCRLNSPWHLVRCDSRDHPCPAIEAVQGDGRESLLSSVSFFETLATSSDHPRTQIHTALTLFRFSAIQDSRCFGDDCGQGGCAPERCP